MDSLIFAASKAHATRTVVSAAMVLAFAGCADRTTPVVAIAMGGDVLTPSSMLPGHQQHFNDSVGLRRHVDLRIGKDSAEAAKALVWAGKLVLIPGLVGVVGHESSRSALQAAPIYRDYGVVQIVPTGTSQKLSKVSPWTFPLVASDSLQGEVLAHFLAASGRKRLTMLVQDDEYGRGIVSSIKIALGSTDVQTLENVMHTPQSDLDLLVRSMLSHVPKPDVMLLVAQGGTAVRVAKLVWERDPTVLIIGSDAAISGAAELRALAPAPDRLALATYWLPDSSNAATRTFLREFHASRVGGEPQWNHAATYDAVGLLNTAAAEVGADRKAVRDWLLSLGRNRPPYQGVLGPIDFTGKHAIAARLIQPSSTGWEPVK